MLSSLVCFILLVLQESVLTIPEPKPKDLHIHLQGLDKVVSGTGEEGEPGRKAVETNSNRMFQVPLNSNGRNEKDFFHFVCKCNGETDSFGRGGKCTRSSMGHYLYSWCYVNENTCNDERMYNGKYMSFSSCSSHHIHIDSSVCSCNGKPDYYGRGGYCTASSRGSWCYVNENACDDQIKIYGGKFVSFSSCSRNVCKCNGKADSLGQGGDCGTWCYVDPNVCNDERPYNGKYVSLQVCSEQTDNHHIFLEKENWLNGVDPGLENVENQSRSEDRKIEDGNEASFEVMQHRRSWLNMMKGKKK